MKACWHKTLRSCPWRIECENTKASAYHGCKLTRYKKYKGPCPQDFQDAGGFNILTIENALSALDASTKIMLRKRRMSR